MDANKLNTADATQAYKYLMAIDKKLDKVPIDKSTGKPSEIDMINIFKETIKLPSDSKSEKFTGEFTPELRKELKDKLDFIESKIDIVMRDGNLKKSAGVLKKMKKLIKNKMGIIPKSMDVIKERIEGVREITMRMGDEGADQGRKIISGLGYREGPRAGLKKVGNADDRYSQVLGKVLRKNINKEAPVEDVAAKKQAMDSYEKLHSIMGRFNKVGVNEESGKYEKKDAIIALMNAVQLPGEVKTENFTGELTDELLSKLKEKLEFLADLIHHASMVKELDEVANLPVDENEWTELKTTISSVRDILGTACRALETETEDKGARNALHTIGENVKFESDELLRRMENLEREQRYVKLKQADEDILF